MRNKPVRSLSIVCLNLLLAIALTGCDGGIFGTGDGSSSNGILDAAISSDNDSSVNDSLDGGQLETPAAPTDEMDTSPDSSPTAAPIEMGADSASVADDSNLFGFNASTDAVISIGTSNAFTNDVVISDGPSAEIEFINLTDVTASLFVSANNDAAPILSTTVNQIQASGFVPSTTGRVFIDSIDNNGERRTLALIEPTTLAPGSKSLLILRSIEPTVDYIILPSNIAEPEQLQNSVGVRLVSTALIGDPTVPSVFVLNTISEGGLGEPSPFSFEPLTYLEPVSNYEILPPTTFNLFDDAGRFSIESIDLRTPGSLVTIVLDPSLPDQHLVIEH